MEWNYADIYEAIAEQLPDAACQVQGDRTITWAEFDRRSDALAAALLASGLGHQAKVAIYLRNCPEFIEAYVACLKARLVPVNINFRYGHDELVHVLGNAEAEAVVFHTRYAPTLSRCRADLPLLGHFFGVDDRSTCPRVGPVLRGRGRRGGLAPGSHGAATTHCSSTPAAPPVFRRAWCGDRTRSIRALGTAANFYMGRPPADDLDDLVVKLDRPGSGSTSPARSCTPPDSSPASR